MKFKQFINEKYLTTFSNAGNNIEVFLNPSSKELRDIPSFPAYRFLINFKTKEFYAWHVNTFHDNIMDFVSSKNLAKFPKFKEYWYGHKNNDYIFTGSVDPDGSVYSDHMYTLKKDGDNLKLLKHDFSWLKHFININKLKDLLLADDIHIVDD
jgi:hypothetical protein